MRAVVSRDLSKGLVIELPASAGSTNKRDRTQKGTSNLFWGLRSEGAHAASRKARARTATGDESLLPFPETAQEEFHETPLESLALSGAL